MCGIAGIVNLQHPLPLQTAIQRMTDCIAHRGPDAEGFFVDDHIALGHRRLSIIDVSENANQPIWDHTGRYVIIFNGELYNYQEIRKQLPQYPFRTQSDTETVLACYEHYGVQCLQHMNGMFAFALWDTAERKLFVARDRLGKKPFYYALNGEHFLFSSEVRSLLKSGLIHGELNEEYLSEYFYYQAPMGTHTLVKGISCLQAGHYAIIKNGIYEEIPYWSYAGSHPCDDDLPTAQRKIKDLFLDSVRLRMISDVPFGAFLSGGIDSSLVVACMAELSSQPVSTFNISFTEKDFDESEYANVIAKKYSTHHHRIEVKPEAFLDCVDDILSAMDSPSGDGPNTYLVSKYTKQAGIKVALSGLGGDELFAGYDKFLRFHQLMKNKWLLKFPKALRQLAAGGLHTFMPGNRFTKFGQLMNLEKWDLPNIYPILRRSYSDIEIQSILHNPAASDEVAKNLTLIHERICWMESFSKATIGEMETYTRDVLLRDTDQMAMAHALEVRVPFFDYRLVEYVLSLPDSFKYPHKPKQLLVDSLAPRLPNEIIHRSKMGFTFPFDRWLRNELFEMADHKINYLADRKEFNGDEVRLKWNKFQRGDTTILWSRIWKLIVLSDWLERNQL